MPPRGRRVLIVRIIIIVIIIAIYFDARESECTAATASWQEETGSGASAVACAHRDAASHACDRPVRPGEAGRVLARLRSAEFGGD